ncbi:hypothetical protein Tco_0175139 [Tanacetum coccineum]
MSGRQGDPRFEVPARGKGAEYQIDFYPAGDARYIQFFFSNVSFIGEEANVAEKKKVKESMEANLGKSLKDNA